MPMRPSGDPANHDVCGCTCSPVGSTTLPVCAEYARMPFASLFVPQRVASLPTNLSTKGRPSTRRRYNAQGPRFLGLRFGAYLSRPMARLYACCRVVHGHKPSADPKLLAVSFPFRAACHAGVRCWRFALAMCQCQ